MKPVLPGSNPYHAQSLVVSTTTASSPSLPSLPSLPALSSLPALRVMPPAPRPLAHPQVPAATLGAVKPLRKRPREMLSTETPAALAERGDPAKFVAAFRANLHSAGELPEGALAGLVRNLVAERAGSQPLPRGELQMLMDVLVAERDALDTQAACQALQGLLDGLGGGSIHPLHVQVLVDRLVCMGLGSPGRCIRDELRTVTAALVQGEQRLDRLGALVDLVLDNGLGLARTRLSEAVAGVALGLQAVSTDASHMDTGLHQRMLERILRPAPERTRVHIRAALKALWEHATQPGAMTPQWRDSVIGQVFACRATAGPRLLSSALMVLTEDLSRRPGADGHRSAVLGTLVRESLRMEPEETRQAAIGLGAGLGGSKMDDATRAWLRDGLADWRTRHSDAGWRSIDAGLGLDSAPAQETARVKIEPMPTADAKPVPVTLPVPMTESVQDSSLRAAMDAEQWFTDAVPGARGRHAQLQQSLTGNPIRERAPRDSVPPHQQLALGEIMLGSGKRGS